MPLLGVRIAGSGSFLPGEPVDNATLVERHGLPCSAEWIAEWTGLESRHRAEAPLDATTMAEHAARAALEAAGLEGAQLKRIFAASSTGDRPMPGMANELQERLQARCDAVDLRNGCHSFLLALDLAVRCVVTGSSPVLVVASECVRGILDTQDRRSFPLFGDGAGAVVLEAAPGGGVLGQHHVSEGRLSRAIWVPGPRDPEPGLLHMSADGRRFRREVPLLLERVVSTALEQAGLRIQELDRVLPHQPNPLWTEAMLQEMGVRPDQVDLFASRTGNLSSATLALALDRAWRDRPPASGERLLLFTVGAGAAAGALVWEVA